MSQLLFYLLLILLPTQLGYHFWPSWALVLGRRVDYLSPTLFFTDIIIILLLLFWTIETIGKSKKNKVFTKIPGRYVIFPLCIIINIWFSVSKAVSIYTWVKFIEFFLLGLYIVTTKPKLSRVVFFLSIGVFYSSLLAIVQFMLQNSIGGPLWFLGERTFTAITPGIAQIPLCILGQPSCPLYLRAYATFPHPNVLGGFLAAILPLVAWQLLNSKNQQSKLYYGITTLVGLVALLFTFSRSAWVVGILAIVFVIVKITNKKILGFLVIVLSIVFVFSTQKIQFTDESVVVRERLATASIKIWQTAPIIGVGLGNFLVALPRFLPSRTVYFLQPVHNIYLLALSELGIIGVVIFLWIIWMALKNTRRKFIIYHLSLIILLILGLIDHYPLSLQQGRLLLTLLMSLSII